MGYVFYKWGMRLDVRGSQMLPDTKAQCRSDEAGIVQAQSREQMTPAERWGKWGLSYPQKLLLASGREPSNLPGSSTSLSPLQNLRGLRDG